MAPSGEFFDKFFGSLVKDGLPILKNVLILLATDVSIPLELLIEKNKQMEEVITIFSNQGQEQQHS